MIEDNVTEKYGDNLPQLPTSWASEVPHHISIEGTSSVVTGYSELYTQIL